MRSKSTAIEFAGQSDVTIVSGRFSNIAGRAIYLVGCSNVSIVDCEFSRVGAGIVAVDCTNVTVTRNHYRNIMGNLPSGRPGQFVQFDKVTTGIISYNRGICDPAVSDPEDIVSVYESTGITVAKNRFKGGGPSTSGSGIMLGDNGGSSLVCEDNVLVETGQVGIGVAGGVGVIVRRNRVYSAARTSSNVGIYAWAQGGVATSGIEVSENHVNWKKADGTDSHLWDGGNVGAITGWNTNVLGGVTASIFDLPPP